MYMTDLLQLMIDSGWNLRAVPIKNGWLEFDTYGDYKKYQQLASEGNLDHLWREKIRDFKICFKLLLDTLTLVTKSTDNPHDIIIYSEGKNFWPHFHGLISTLIMNSCEKVTYLTSSSDDPGLFF